MPPASATYVNHGKVTMYCRVVKTIATSITNDATEMA